MIISRYLQFQFPFHVNHWGTPPPPVPQVQSHASFHPAHGQHGLNGKVKPCGKPWKTRGKPHGLIYKWWMKLNPT